jgi:phosphate transport system permease protein
MMAALPTVILGFLAGLWFAPYLEKNLAGFLLLIPVLLAGLVLLSLLRLLLPQSSSAARFRGKEPLLLIPAVVGLVLLAFALDDPVQAAFFGGSLSHWLEASAGIPFDQRNSLVVGVAMGFAVVPIIFSLAEDALHDVPDVLARGSLALGATPWQTLVRVVLPVASPGIFSALMIGFGRAVGETMIILMVTGNTPIMDWNLFEGMRTLAANITIEAPESELNSSHYRILFLSALVLFVFTFLVNTAAAIIRQRLRSRYSAL